MNHTPRPFYALFFLSGISGLIYQVIWIKQLSLLFGVTTYAISTTVSVFMLGLALGSWYFGRMADRAPNRLKTYCLMELGIGVSALLSLFLIKVVDGTVLWVGTSDVHSAGFLLLRAAGTSLVLFVPCFLMGGTFPMLAREFVGSSKSASGSLGLLYASNTLGGVAGCLLCGFVTIPNLGMRGSLLIGVGINLLVAALANRLAKSHAEAAPSEADAPASETPEPRSALIVVAMSVCFLVSGLAGLAAEVIWTRMLMLNLDCTAQAFAAVLSIYLIGLAIGSLIARRVAERFDPVRGYATVQMAAGIVILFSALGWAALNPSSVGATAWFVNLLPKSAQGNVAFKMLFSLLQSAVLLLIPTVLMGFSFPFAARFFSRDTQVAGRRIGTAYMLNTLGAVAGPILAGFVCLPYLGIQTSILLCAGLFLCAGAALWVASIQNRMRWIALLAPAMFVGAVWMLPKNIMLTNTFPWRFGNVVSYEEDVCGSVTVWENRVNGETQRQLLVGVTSMISDGFPSRRYTRLIGHLPALLHPAPRKALVICLGSGMTLAAVASHPSLERIDCLDLSEGVYHAARDYFGPANDNVLSDPRVRVIVNDGRNHLLVSREQYDVIALEPPPPNNDGVANLYSVEFYQLCREHLREGGLIAQWIPYHSITFPQARSLIGTMQSVFPATSVWELYNGQEYCAIGHRNEGPVPFANVSREFAVPSVKANLAVAGIRCAEDVLACFVMGPKNVRGFTKDALLVTDDSPSIGYDLSALDMSDMGSDARWRSIQESSILTHAYAQDPVEFLTFENNGAKAEFVTRMNSIKKAWSMHALGVRLAELSPAQYTNLFRQSGFVAPLLLEPDNEFYKREAATYNKALLKLIEFAQSIGDKELENKYVTQMQKLNYGSPGA